MRKPKAKKVKTGRVSSIGISRLYNTGNYTNVRYDLSCQIEKGESAKATLLEMVRVLHMLRPISRPSCLDQLEAARKTPLTQRSEYVKMHYPDWLREEAEYKREMARRRQAVEDLDRMGGTATMLDHKLSWEDNDDVPW